MGYQKARPLAWACPLFLRGEIFQPEEEDKDEKTLRFFDCDLSLGCCWSILPVAVRQGLLLIGLSADLKASTMTMHIPGRDKPNVMVFERK
jgi:hypothetical protein